MTAQVSTAYPFIGAVAGERGGILESPTSDTNLFTAPTETFAHFKTLLSSATMGAASMVAGGIGFAKVKFDGTVYRVPAFTDE